MGKIGTILSIAALGGAAIGAFALYRNRNVIGAALSRGTQNAIIDPVGNFFNSLFAGLPTVGATPVPVPKTPAQPKQPFNPAQPIPTREPYKQGTQYTRTVIPGQKPPPFVPTPTPTRKPTTRIPTVSQYYFVDRPGTKYDIQQKLTPDVLRAILQSGYDAYPIGRTRLQDKSLGLFVRSRNFPRAPSGKLF